MQQKRPGILEDDYELSSFEAIQYQEEEEQW